MQIAMLGFGKVCRSVTNKIKEFPEFGRGGKVQIYAIHTKRHSLSYGPDLAVEIPDPHDDGLRTYKDGYQATDNYYTSVTNYEDWILGELAKGAIDTVINCIPYSDDSLQMLHRFLDAAPEHTKFYLIGKPEQSEQELLISEVAELKSLRIAFVEDETNSVDGISEVLVNELRKDLNGGLPWEKVIRSEKFWEDAEQKYEAARHQMAALHVMKRTEAVAERLSEMPAGRTSNGACNISSPITEADLESIQRFVVNGEGSFERNEWYDTDRKCLVVEHEMLNWFFGPFCFEDAATQEFLEPLLRTTSARYYKYDSADSYVEAHVEAPSCGYVIDYVISGDMPWHLNVSGAPPQGVGVLEGVAYKSGLTSRAPLGVATSPVELLVIHFAKTVNGKVPNCTCYQEDK